MTAEITSVENKWSATIYGNLILLSRAGFLI